MPNIRTLSPLAEISPNIDNDLFVFDPRNVNDVVRLLVFSSALEIASLFANWMMNSGSQFEYINGASLKARVI